MTEEHTPAPVESVDAAEPVAEPAEGEAQPLSIALPGLQLVVPLGTNVGVTTQDNGDRFVVIGPFVVQLVLPFNEESARAFARDLAGGIEIASAVPKPGVVLR